MKAIVCDKCKKVITDSLERVSKLEFSNEDSGRFSERHLCDDCLKEFVKWITSK